MLRAPPHELGQSGAIEIVGDHVCSSIQRRDRRGPKTCANIEDGCIESRAAVIHEDLAERAEAIGGPAHLIAGTDAHCTSVPANRGLSAARLLLP